MLEKPIRDTHNFLLSYYFSEGLRITFGVLMPSLIMAQYGLLELGMTLSLGALCVSIVDSPGPIHHRKTAMSVTVVLIFLVSILVGLTNKSVVFSGFLVWALSFVFSMLFVYGNRASAIGISVLLIMVLSIDDVRPWQTVLSSSSLLLLGGLWYGLLSYSVYRLRPYRLAQQSLSESLEWLAKFLRIKARFYQKDIDFEKLYSELLDAQIEVHHKQENVREVLFKTREFLRDASPYSRFLVVIFADAVDLYEHIMSTFYNYKNLHQQFDDSGVLEDFHEIILNCANQLDQIAFALKSGGTPSYNRQQFEQLSLLKGKVSRLETEQGIVYSESGLIALKNIINNLENILNRLQTLKSYFNEAQQKNIKLQDVDVSKFVDSQAVNLKLFTDNISFKSSTFRHAFRVAVIMLIGFVVSRYLNSSHSYWTLLTILVISKPGFSLTKERNYQRIVGTIVGAIVGIAIMHFIKDKHALFVILILFMIASYSFQRINYVVSVLFMTPFILIIFDFLGMGTIALAQERIINTLIGSGIAFAASYFILPNWEHENINEAMEKMLLANRSYFNEVRKITFQRTLDTTSFKLARKEVFVNASNIASLFQRMFSEPKQKQHHIKELHQFTVLNHLLSSYIASLNLLVSNQKIDIDLISHLLPLADNTLNILQISADILVEEASTDEPVELKNAINPTSLPISDTLIPISDQLMMIQKVSIDICKICKRMITV